MVPFLISPELALLENEEEEIGGHTVERVMSLAGQVTRWLFVDLYRVVPPDGQLCARRFLILQSAYDFFEVNKKLKRARLL